MLAQILHQITHISDDEMINLENYMESLNFVNVVYNFTNKMKMIVPTSQITFLPSFKGRMTCEKFNLSSDEKENEMRYFITSSTLFLEDRETKKEQIKEIIEPICEMIEFDGEKITFILR